MLCYNHKQALRVLTDHFRNENFEFYGIIDEVMPRVLSFRVLQICCNCATRWTSIAITKLFQKKPCWATVQRGELEGKTGNVICKTKSVTHKKVELKFVNSVPLRHASAWYNNFNAFHPAVLWHINIYCSQTQQISKTIAKKCSHVIFFNDTIKITFVCLTIIYKALLIGDGMNFPLFSN
jgi:hypothetical protein